MNSYIYANKKTQLIVNKRNLSIALCMMALFCLSINYLLYSFFKINFDRNILRIVAGILLMISIIIKRSINVKELVLLFFAFYMLIINGSLTQNIAYILVASIAIPFSAEKLWKKVSKYQLLLAGVVIASLVFGVVPNLVTSTGGRIRNTLGFLNVNGAAVFFFSVIIIWLICQKKIKWYMFIVAFAAALVLYFFTDTRSLLFCVGIFFLSFIILQLFKGRTILVGTCIVEGLLFIIPNLIGVFYRLFPRLNVLLSYRLSLFASFINRNDIKSLLFGGSTVKDIDNFYLCLLYNSGLIFFVFVAVITIYSTWFYWKTRQVKYIAFILSILAFGIMESGALRCEIICMLMFWYIILQPIKSQE